MFVNQSSYKVYRISAYPTMAGNRPMITLQCGNYANYIGTHFWNLQVAVVTIQLEVI